VKENNGSAPSNEEYEQSITELQSMGFGRQECENAMKLADNNTERAVEFLLNGYCASPANPPPPPANPFENDDGKQDALEKLALMGFTEEQVMEAFAACDNNEELVR
jgi:uncharacterized UBP type Zn finger protein